MNLRTLTKFDNIRLLPHLNSMSSAYMHIIITNLLFVQHNNKTVQYSIVQYCQFCSIVLYNTRIQKILYNSVA